MPSRPFCLANYNPGGNFRSRFRVQPGILPVFYNYKPSARRGYLFDDVSPLFAFGYGLSYTTFALRNVRLEKKSIARKESTRVLVDVTNTGRRARQRKWSDVYPGFGEFSNQADQRAQRISEGLRWSRVNKDRSARHHA